MSVPHKKLHMSNYDTYVLSWGGGGGGVKVTDSKDMSMT
ncbi:Uncharacterised protein [Klebsiella pneumoniae]|nr:Uncharacterised protein [Klebsiella pneumoniae]